MLAFNAYAGFRDAALSQTHVCILSLLKTWRWNPTLPALRKQRVPAYATNLNNWEYCKI